MTVRSLLPPRQIGTFLLFGAAFLLVCSSAFAQIPEPIRKEFDLDIKNDRITETDFQRSTAVKLDLRELMLRIGAAVSAERIDVTLRNVTGHVKFVASLERLRPIVRRRLGQ